MAGHLRGLVARLGLAACLGAGLLVASLPSPAAAEAAFVLALVAVVAGVSWWLPAPERWALVMLAAGVWTLGTLEGSALVRLGAWPWPVALLRFGVLASLSLGVSGFRRALERLLRTEDLLAATLLRERDSARRDRLTRLWNARHFHDALEQEIARCRRYNRPFGLLLLDLDGFKAVNDTAGHLAGDQVLQVVGRLLHEHCRATDVPARLGGDEFAVLLPEASSLTARRLAAKLVALVAEAPFPAHLPAVTASVGGVAFARAPESARAALQAADEMLYAAKRQGKNRFVVASEERRG